MKQLSREIFLYLILDLHFKDRATCATVTKQISMDPRTSRCFLLFLSVRASVQLAAPSSTWFPRDSSTIIDIKYLPARTQESP